MFRHTVKGDYLCANQESLILGLVRVRRVVPLTHRAGWVVPPAYFFVENIDYLHLKNCIDIYQLITMHFDRLQTLNTAGYTQILAGVRQDMQDYLRRPSIWKKELRFVLNELIPEEADSLLMGVTVSPPRWLNEDSLQVDTTDTRQPHYYVNRIIIELQVIYGTDGTQERRPYTKSSTLIVEHFFNADDRSYHTNSDFHTETKWQLRSIDRKVVNLYEQWGLDDSQFTIDRQDLQGRFTQQVYTKKSNAEANPLYIYLDLTYALQRVRYSIAQIKLYSPYLDNPLWHAREFGGYEVFPSNRSNFDDRYLLYCEVAYQSIYNFWERIGAVIALCIPTSLSSSQIFFTSVIRRLSENTSLLQNEHFNWLLSYKQDDSDGYGSVNKNRKEIVHYSSMTARFIQSHLDSASDRAKIEELVAWTQKQPDLLINAFQQALEGIRQVIQLFESLPDPGPIPPAVLIQ